MAPVCRYAVHYDDQDMDDWRPPPDPYGEFGSDLGWGDESFFEAPHEREKGFLRLDSHILNTPAIGDIDGDGHLEVVVAASYYFDQDYYADEVTPQPAAEAGVISQETSVQLVMLSSTLRWNLAACTLTLLTE